MDSQGPVRGGFAVAVCFIIAAVLVVLLGAVRYWRQQTAMARGKVWAGGFELLLIMGLVISVSGNWTLVSRLEKYLSRSLKEFDD